MNNKVLKFEEYVNEGLWSSGMKRAENDEIRRENGVKVNTSIGTLVLVNKEWDYKLLIMDMIESAQYGTWFHVNEIDDYNSDEIRNIQKGSLDYVHMLNNNLVISFESYDEVFDGDLEEYGDNISEEDYITICKAVAATLSEKPLMTTEKNWDPDHKEIYFIMYNTDDTEKIISPEGLVDALKIKTNNSEVEVYMDDDTTMVGVVVDWDNYDKYNEIKKFTDEFVEKA